MVRTMSTEQAKAGQEGVGKHFNEKYISIHDFKKYKVHSNVQSTRICNIFLSAGYF